MKSALSINDIINFSLKENKTHACLIDIDTMFGTIEFYNACLKNNLKPVIGLQIDGIVYIAKNNNGLKQLYKLSSKQTTSVSDCFTISLTNTEFSGSFKHFLLKDIAARENFCSSLDETIILKAVNAIEEGITLEEVKINCENTNMLTSEEASKIYSSSAINNLEEIINSVDISISQNQKINFVTFDETRSSKEYLEELCQISLKRKIQNITEVYTERLKTELQVINQMGFNDYFLVVQDFINYAKTNNIYIGPGRGSAAGSLVSYALNITEVDPIPNNLIFERFLNIDRKTMPDIDTDIEDDLRFKVVEYLFNK
jgi:DNA polymerase-3 subunit alpha